MTRCGGARALGGLALAALATAAVDGAGPPPKPVFVDVTERAGIRWAIDRVAAGGWNLVETMGGGGGFVDFDRDGRLDLYLVSYTLERQADGSVPRDALYRNNGNGTFTDVTARAGFGGPMRGMGLAAGDYDNDGWPDLYVSGFRAHRLYHNNRNGTFTDVTAAAGLPPSLWGTSAAFFDADDDGDLDLFVCHYLDVDPDAALPCQMIGGRPFCSIDRFRGSPSVLYRNDGGRFTEVGAAAGVSRPDGKGLGVVAADLDGDGRIDLFQANDTSPNFLYRNRGNGTFAEVGLAAEVAFDTAGRARGAMGVDVADENQDGRLDLFVTNFTHQGHSLFRDAGDGTYRDAAREAGLYEVSLPLSGFGARFLDEDNDGLVDLAVAHGHPFRAGGQGVARDPVRRARLPVREHRPRLPRRGAPARPRDGAADGGTRPRHRRLRQRRRPRPPAHGRRRGARLLRNDGGNRHHWLGVRLEGTRSNRDGVGAVVRVRAAGKEQVKVRAGGTSYASASDPRLLFGLASARRVQRLEVRWPTGQVSVQNDLPVDRYATVREGEPAGRGQ